VGRRRGIETAPRWGDTEESRLAVTLPYDFDTMALPRKILSVMVGGSALMVFFALVMFIKSGPLAAAPFPLAAVFLAWVARKYITTLAGLANGAINRDAVVIEPSALGPLHLPSPIGTYRLGQFKAVRVIYSGPVPGGSGGYFFANVYLIGRDGTADVCIASERDTTAKALAPEIAAAVGLPLEQEGLAPLDHYRRE
jgi:hypothetical protein